MAAIDLIFWSYGLTPERNALLEHLRSTPEIWLPFFELGPGWIFGFGLYLPRVYYLRKSPIGVFLVVVGGLMLLFGVRHYVVLGYPVIIVGYSLCFWRDRRA